LPEDHEATTIGGVVLERPGRMAEPGDVVELDGLRLEVIQVKEGRPRQVRIVEEPTADTPVEPGGMTSISVRRRPMSRRAASSQMDERRRRVASLFPIVDVPSAERGP
jgi:hypothetical protein